ncbi:MAG: NADH-quinone oxidoreductase subunit L [Proteobacteria bacterium]|nr:NADH-quinone oxidoreductase subunit L [Pseudomonadota bacterium]
MMITLLVILPLAGFLVNGIMSLSPRRWGPYSANLPGITGTGVMLMSFLIAVFQFLKLRMMAPVVTGSPVLEETLFPWIHLGRFAVDYGFRFDLLSGTFTLVITGVGSLIHLYSMGYMAHDKGIARYFAYLNLFCFMMLNLVLGQSLVQIFLGWEGVGLASYLLIGFWYQDILKVHAGQKAFMMNRIGDLGFLFAIFLAYGFAGSVDALAVAKATPAPAIATAFGVLVFVACSGKSAQIPLFTWLPDAMAGPTPVSALIHAATMVTSGVYLLARLNPVISSSPGGLALIGGLGAATALVAAVLACFQSDIKKILAYSTISQLGFMFTACGAMAYGAGVFHVMTHAFFKALLFLGAGSVIHALSGQQDIFKMGGLRKALPFTFWSFTAGWAAILGLPPFSGFFSKDGIIHEVWVSTRGGPVLGGVLLLSALLTAYYMTRLYVLVFLGDSRITREEKDHLHESPLVMTVPLMLLAIASLAGGWFGAPVAFPHSEVGHGSHAVSENLIMAASVAVALLGAGFAWMRYGKKAKPEPVLDPFRIDAFYGAVFGKGVMKLSSFVGRILEDALVQRFSGWTSSVVGLTGNLIRVVQTGSAQAYLVMIVIAMAAVLSWLFFGVGGYGKF